MAVLAVAAVAGAVAWLETTRQRDYRALLARGDAALRDDQTFGAIESYSGAIALRPDSMLAHLRLGETYQRRGDLEQAAREFRTASAIDPAATRPLEELGDAQYQLQRYARAAEAYERSHQLDDRSARVAYKLALARYRAGALDDAVVAVEDAIRLDPRMADAHYVLGLCRRDQRRLPEALAAFERASALAPGSIPAREELADVFRALQRPAEELEQLQALAALDHEHVERLVAVGLAHARAGHGDLAVLTLGNALEHAPDQPLIYGALGQVWLDMASVRSDALPKALEALERVAAYPTTSSEILTVYGRALLLDGNAEAAERTLHQATTRSPIEPSAYLFYATAAERLGHLEDARAALIRYGAVMPNDPELAGRAARIASLSLRLNDLASAVDWFQRALSAKPEDVRLLAALGDAQLRAGDVDGALATVERGLQKDAANVALAAVKGKIENVKGKTQKQGPSR